jgi:hypothetical protein
MAEEEGFDSLQYESATCWHALVRYSQEIENKEFAFCHINTGFPSLLMGALFVANVAWRMAIRTENRSRLCQELIDCLGRQSKRYRFWGRSSSNWHM